MRGLCPAVFGGYLVALLVEIIRQSPANKVPDRIIIGNPVLKRLDDFVYFASQFNLKMCHLLIVVVVKKNAPTMLGATRDVNGWATVPNCPKQHPLAFCGSLVPVATAARLTSDGIGQQNNKKTKKIETL